MGTLAVVPKTTYLHMLQNVHLWVCQTVCTSGDFILWQFFFPSFDSCFCRVQMSTLCSEPCFGHMESCTSPTENGDQIILSCLPQHLQFSCSAEAANLDVCNIFSINVHVLSHSCYYGVLSVLWFKWESSSQGLVQLCSAQHWSMDGISSSAPHRNPLIFSPAAHCAVSISKILFVRAIDIKNPIDELHLYRNFSVKQPKKIIFPRNHL